MEPCTFCNELINVVFKDIHLQYYCPGIDSTDHTHHNTVAHHSRSSNYMHKGAIPKNTNIRDMMKPGFTECIYCNTPYNVAAIFNHEKGCIHRPTQCDSCDQRILLKDLNMHKCTRRESKFQNRQQSTSKVRAPPYSEGTIWVRTKKMFERFNEIEARNTDSTHNKHHWESQAYFPDNFEQVDDSLLPLNKFVSCAIQTDVSAIDTKNPKDQDLPSRDIKVNKFVSCAIQTDVSAIDTKNPEDQDLPSHDTKDVTLLTESMKELLIKGSDHDVKIIVKDKQFQAHRLILRTRSPVFAMMLTHDSQESITGTINIEDCDPDSFDEFLLYLYSGRTENLTPAKALHLYYTADKYDIPALKERCVILLKTSLSVESICDVLLLATRHNEKELLEQATKFFAQNMREILVTVHWQKFLSENPIEGNELYIKSMEVLVPRK